MLILHLPVHTDNKTSGVNNLVYVGYHQNLIRSMCPEIQIVTVSVI